MKPCVDRVRFSALATAAFAAGLSLSARAQTGVTPQLKEIFVTATRSAQPIGDVVADVTIIDREVIERSGAAALADVLARVPGIEIVRLGGAGNSTTVFTRGGESRHTLVLIDGVRMDSQSTSGGANWQAIPLAQIDRIEIVRGPTSAVYGSDAAAGVIQIFTKKGEGAFSPIISFGYGTYNTQKIDLSASGSVNSFDYALGVAQTTSDGFNSRPIATQNPDSDGYKSMNVNGRLGFQINAEHRLEANFLNNKIAAQYDQGLTRDFIRANQVETVGIQWQAKWSQAYNTRLGVTYGTDRGEDALNGSTLRPPFDQTKTSGFIWQNNYQTGAHALSATLENKKDQFLLMGTTGLPTNVTSLTREKSQNSLALGYGWAAGVHTVQFNVRHDRDSEFGGKSTGSAAYALAITPRWKISGSVGTSFRVPTLYQRFTVFSPPTPLLPESGRNVELGLKYVEGTRRYGVVAYRNKLTNLLTFVSGAGPCPSGLLPAATRVGCYANTAQASYTGLTFTASESIGNFNLYGSLDVQNPKDLTLNKQLARRAKRHATFGVDTRIGAWTLAGDVLMSALRYENTTATSPVLPGYTLVNLSASTPLSKDWKALVRVDNLTDKTYQTINGYASARRALYVGLTWAPQ
ncbi:TonB-dependent receptor [Polaromonas sp. YR568]|uniref:TonB-dependent receptor domain-containing protein n=1 Tax=Polaromonas sp. YR568 TaxID=1855301 RepID=UPI0031378F11